MHFYKSYGLLISSEIELPELSEINDQGFIDLKVSKEEFAIPELVKTNIHRRGIRAFFGEDDHGSLFLRWEGVADFKAIGGDLLLINPKTDDLNLLTLFTVSEALGLILFQKGYFLLHASSVKVGSEAWCFMGNPGAGKSTTAAAFIKAGCKLLSDDLTAIKFDETGNAFIIPAYPQLKIWDNTVEGLDYDKTSLSPVSEGVNKFSYQPKGTFEHEPVALKRIFFLHHAKNRAVLKEMSGHEIPTEMLRNFPLPFPLLKGNLLKEHFLQCFKCAQSAGVWKMRRPNGFEKLESWVKECVVLNLIKASADQ